MDTSPIIDYYPTSFRTDLNGKQQEWEAVVLIPFIDEVSSRVSFAVVATLLRRPSLLQCCCCYAENDSFPRDSKWRPVSSSLPSDMQLCL